jgi:hypothetical protein
MIALCTLLVGVSHLAGIYALTPKGRSELLVTFILFGTVFTIAGVWLLRADLTPLFRPSRYDIAVGLIAVVTLSYYASWIIGKKSWLWVTMHSPLSVDHMYPVVGVGFLLTFGISSCVWGFHVMVLLSPRLRKRLHPSLLSHLAALLLLIPSLKYASNMAAIMEFFSRPAKTSNQALQPTADPRE